MLPWRLGPRTIDDKTSHHLGGDNHLGIVVASYEPHVRCRGIANGILESCQNIVDTMPADTMTRDFGPGASAVNLPHTFLSRKSSNSTTPDAKAERNFLVDNKCSLTVTTSGPSDRLAWYSLWEAAVALAGVCVFANQKGIQTNLGMVEQKIKGSVTDTEELKGSNGRLQLEMGPTLREADALSSS